MPHSSALERAGYNRALGSVPTQACLNHLECIYAALSEDFEQTHSWHQSAQVWAKHALIVRWYLECQSTCWTEVAVLRVAGGP